MYVGIAKDKKKIILNFFVEQNVRVGTYGIHSVLSPELGREPCMW